MANDTTASTPDLADFTAKAQAFLDGNAKRRAPKKAFVWGEGDDGFGGLEDRSRDKELDVVKSAMAWRQKKFDAGFGWLNGPTEFGGAGLTGAHDRVYSGLEAEYDIPSQACFNIGLGMVAPTILAHASQLAKDLYLKKLWRGEIIGAQLFSEPGAGSDLASLQTKAIRDGEEWVITGQKVWTSGAHYADIGEIICRTDVDLPKHKGLTGFIIDMRDPAVEIRPLKQMSGASGFNEVFINELRVKDDHRLGDVNNGWNVALTTLMNERSAIGANNHSDSELLEKLTAMVRKFGLDKDPIVRNELANIVMHYRVAGLNSARALARLRSGQMPGPEMSTAKMALTMNQARVVKFVSHVLGPKLQADTGEWGTFAWSQMALSAPGLRIAGGTDEVMRNIVGERVLGLPKEPGIDSNSPFKDLRVN